MNSACHKSEQTKSILGEISSRLDYYVNPNGAGRVLCGYYEASDTMIPTISSGTYQNGAYWYIVSYYLAMASARQGNTKMLAELYRRVSAAVLKYGDQGLAEWYYQDGRIGGAPHYSWSIMYPVFLVSVLQGRNSVYKIGANASFLDDK